MISNYHTTTASTDHEPIPASYSYTFGGMDNDETALSQGRRSSSIKSHRKRWFRGTMGRGAKVHNNLSNESTDNFSYSTDGSSIAMQSAGQSTVDSSSVDYSIPQMLQEKQKKKVMSQQQQPQQQSLHPQGRPLSLSRCSIHSMSQQSLEYSTDGESSSCDFSFDGSALEGSVLIQQHLAEQELKKEKEEEKALLLRKSNGDGQHEDQKHNINNKTTKKNTPNPIVKPGNNDMVDINIDDDDDDGDCPDDESQQDLVVAQSKAKRIAQSSTNVYSSFQNKQQSKNNKQQQKQRQQQQKKKKHQQSGIEDIFHDLPRWCCGGLAAFL